MDSSDFSTVSIVLALVSVILIASLVIVLCACSKEQPIDDDSDQPVSQKSIETNSFNREDPLKTPSAYISSLSNPLFTVHNSNGVSFVLYYYDSTVKALWIDGRTGGFKRELKSIEKSLAYGVKMKGMSFEVTALSKYPVSLVQQKKQFIPVIQWKGEEKRLIKVFVEMKSKMKVDHIEITLEPVKGGKRTVERITK